MSSEPVASDRVLTVPNLLSLLRLLLVPVFAWAIITRRDGLAFAVLAVSGITDYLDGALARRWGQVSRVGQLLDPVADRLYILSTLVGLGLREIVPWWVVGLIVPLRDLLLCRDSSRCCAPARVRPATRALPRQGRDLLPALRLPAAAARRRDEGVVGDLARRSAGPSPGGASACTGGRGSSTCARSATARPPTERWHRASADERHTAWSGDMRNEVPDAYDGGAADHALGPAAPGAPASLPADQDARCRCSLDRAPVPRRGPRLTAR